MLAAMSTSTRGYSARKDSHLKRLRRAEGQVRGLQLSLIHIPSPRD